MPSRPIALAALLILSAEAQSVNYRGRVLDRAALLPVAGATVQAGGLAALTDAQGRFSLQGNPTSIGHMVPRPPRIRRARTRLRISGWDYITLTGATRSFSQAGGGTETGAATAKRAAVEVTVRKDKLLAKTLSPASADADLGDIVLDYPPRRPGVGAPAPYGAHFVFPATGDSASARALLDSLWIHKMNSWRQGQSLGITPVLWKVVPDPESGPAAYRPSLLPCCLPRNGSPEWGYDDIITRKTYRDYQLHLEFNMMGTSNGNADTAGWCNSGVFITGGLELQIQTPDPRSATQEYWRLHDLATLINQKVPDRNMHLGPGKWQSYDVTWRAPRNSPGKVTVYWNGERIHNNVDWGSGAGNPVGFGLQNEKGTDVRFRNVWIKELVIDEPKTDFGY